MTKELTKIPLHEILASNGYIYDRQKDSQSWRVLKNPNGDKVIISRHKNSGDYLYFNPLDDRDRGNIYNFCKNRGIKPDDLLAGKVISDFKSEISMNAEYSSTFAVKKYKELDGIKENNYFVEKRKIDKNFLSLFNEIKTDTYKNIIIPTYTIQKIKPETLILTLSGFVSYLKSPIKSDKNGVEYEKPLKQLCYGAKGFEILKAGDTKSMKDEIKRIVLCESSIDSLSLVQIKNYKPEETLLCATNGQFTNSHTEILEYLAKECKNAEFVLGFDNDSAGKRYREKALQIVPKATILKPVLKDFNDDLIVSKILQVNPQELSVSLILNEAIKLDKKASYLVNNHNILLLQAKIDSINEIIEKDYPKYKILKEKASQILRFEKLEKTFKQVKDISGNFQSRSILTM